jgi:hypothetical protein
MKELLPPFALVAPVFASVSQEQLSFWEKMMDKWGIALVSLTLFGALAWWTAKREQALQKRRDEKEAQDHQERVGLAEKNNELTAKLVQLTEKQIQVQQDTVSELKLRRCSYGHTSPQER